MKSQGFTLLEAIVALVLMATTGITLLNWINTNLQTIQRLQHLQQRHEAIRNALVFMDNINPMEQPQGEETLGIYTFNWDTTVLEFPKRGVDTAGAKSTFDIGLYETAVKISTAGTQVAQVTIRQVGFKQLYKDLPNDDF